MRVKKSKTNKVRGGLADRKATSAVEKSERKSPPAGYPMTRDQYADPENWKYPIDREHIRAAISYFSKPENASQYPRSRQRAIWGRIRSAAKRFGIELAEDSGPPSVEKSYLLKAKYLKRWRGKDGKWEYEYESSTGSWNPETGVKPTEKKPVKKKDQKTPVTAVQSLADTVTQSANKWFAAGMGAHVLSEAKGMDVSDVLSKLETMGVQFDRKQAEAVAKHAKTVGLQVTKSEDLAKAKYVRRWKGKNGKWEYEYPGDKKEKKTKKINNHVSLEDLHWGHIHRLGVGSKVNFDLGGGQLVTVNRVEHDGKRKWVTSGGKEFGKQDFEKLKDKIKDFEIHRKGETQGEVYPDPDFELLTEAMGKRVTFTGNKLPSEKPTTQKLWVKFVAVPERDGVGVIGLSRTKNGPVSHQYRMNTGKVVVTPGARSGGKSGDIR